MNRMHWIVIAGFLVSVSAFASDRGSQQDDRSWSLIERQDDGAIALIAHGLTKEFMDEALRVLAAADAVDPLRQPESRTGTVLPGNTVVVTDTYTGVGRHEGQSLPREKGA